MAGTLEVVVGLWSFVSTTEVAFGKMDPIRLEIPPRSPPPSCEDVAVTEARLEDVEGVSSIELEEVGSSSAAEIVEVGSR